MAHPHELVRAVARGETVPVDQVTAEAADSAIEHRMPSLVLGALERVDGSSNEHVASLVAFDLAVSARRRQQDAVLADVHDRLAAAGVTHTFVKGPVSALRWFEKPTDRPYSDIDVVVPRGPDLVEALAALAPAHPALPILRSAEDEALLSSIDLLVDGVRVDLQTDALRMGLVPADYEGWSVGASELETRGFRVFDTERDLVMFVLHQARDRFRFLLGAAELRRRIDSDIDWARVETLSRDEGIWEQVAAGLSVLCREVGVDLPVAVPRNWRSSMWLRLWKPEVCFLGEVGRIRHIFRGRWLMPLSTRGRTWDAVGHMVRSIFPPDPLLRLRYPQATGPYVWRVLTLRLRVIGRRRLWVWRHQGRDSPPAGSDRSARSDDRS